MNFKDLAENVQKFDKLLRFNENYDFVIARDNDTYINYYRCLLDECPAQTDSLINKNFFLSAIENPFKGYEIAESVFIIDRESDRLCGVFRYNLMNYISKNCLALGINVSFAYLNPDYRGKGISSEMIRLLIDDVEHYIPSYIEKCLKYMNDHDLKFDDKIDASISFNMQCASEDGNRLNKRIIKEVQGFLSENRIRPFYFENNTLSYIPKQSKEYNR